MGNKQGKGSRNGPTRSATTTTRTPNATQRNASAPPPRDGVPIEASGGDCK